MSRMKGRWRVVLISFFSLTVLGLGGLFLENLLLRGSNEGHVVIQYTQGLLRWDQVAPLGANAVEHLERQMEVRPSPFSSLYRWVWPYFPNPVGTRLGRPFEHEMIRLRAVNGLKALGPEARPAIPSLLAIVNDPVENVRVHAIRAMEAIGGDADEIIVGIRSSIDFPTPVHDVIWTLTTRGGKRLGTRKIVEHHRSYRYRVEVARYLVRLDERQVSYAAEICRQNLSDAEISMQFKIQSLLALGEIAPDHGKDHIDMAIEILETTGVERFDSERSMLIRYFGKLGVEGRKAVPQLLELVEGIKENPEKEGLLMNAVGAIGKLDPKSTETLGVLSGLSLHLNKDVRYNALFSIGQLDLAKAMVLPSVSVFLEDSSPRVRAAAAGHLWRLNPTEGEDSLGVCQALLDSQNDLAKREALSVLSKMGPSASRLLPELRAREKMEDDPLNVIAFARAILKISGTEETEILQKLEVLRSLNPGAVSDRVNELLEELNR